MQNKKIDPTLLIRVGEWSLRPVDIKRLNWDFKNPVSGERVTSGSLSDDSRILFKESEPTYAQDIETLKFVSNSANWIPKTDWLVNFENKPQIKDQVLT